MHYLLVLLHGGIQLLGQVVGNIGHAGLLLVGAANAAFVFVGFLVVLFLGILAVTLTALQSHEKLSDQLPFPRLWGSTDSICSWATCYFQRAKNGILPA